MRRMANPQESLMGIASSRRPSDDRPLSDRSDDLSDGELSDVSSASSASSASPADAAVPLEGDFTPRAVLVGLAVGVLLAFTNLYFGLQTGWISMMSLQSALVGYALFQLPSPFPPSAGPAWLRAALSFDRPFSPQENVVLQTTAVATGTLPLAAGLVGIIPALGMLDERLDGQPPIRMGYWGLVGWSLGICFFGWVEGRGSRRGSVG